MLSEEENCIYIMQRRHMPFHINWPASQIPIREANEITDNNPTRKIGNAPTFYSPLASTTPTFATSSISNLKSFFALFPAKSMKLFNWVHRKLSHKDESSENAKKDGDVARIDSNLQIVKENETFGDNHVFNDWKGGILTIGTFGYHQLEDNIENEKKTGFSLENDESDQITDSDDDDEEENDGMNVPLLEMKIGDFENSLKDDSDVIKKERTTLADLFCADSVELDEKQPIGKGQVVGKEKMNVNKKHGLSFSKKLIQEEASWPIHKLHRLMRRMLKRKIHPELGLNKDNLNNYEVPGKFCGVNETTSLLPIPQDATI